MDVVDMKPKMNIRRFYGFLRSGISAQFKMRLLTLDCVFLILAFLFVSCK